MERMQVQAIGSLKEECFGSLFECAEHDRLKGMNVSSSNFRLRVNEEVLAAEMFELLCDDLVPATCGSKLLLEAGFTARDICDFVASEESIRWKTKVDGVWKLTPKPTKMSGWTVIGLRNFLRRMQQKTYIFVSDESGDYMLPVGQSFEAAYLDICYGGEPGYRLVKEHWSFGSVEQEDDLDFEEFPSIKLFSAGFADTVLPSYGYDLDCEKDEKTREYNLAKENAQRDRERISRREKKKYARALSHCINRMPQRDDSGRRRRSDKKTVNYYEANLTCEAFTLSNSAFALHLTSSLLMIYKYSQTGDVTTLIAGVMNSVAVGISVPACKRFIEDLTRGQDLFEFLWSLAPEGFALFKREPPPAMVTQDDEWPEVDRSAGKPEYYSSSGFLDQLDAFGQTKLGKVVTAILSSTFLAMIAQTLSTSLDYRVASNLLRNIGKDFDLLDFVIDLGKRGVDYLATLFPNYFTNHLTKLSELLEFAELERKIQKATFSTPAALSRGDYAPYKDDGVPGFLRDTDRLRELSERYGKPIFPKFEAACAEFRAFMRRGAWHMMPCGIAIVGPPGVGKTNLVQSIWDISRDVYERDKDDPKAVEVSIRPEAKFDDPYNGEYYVLLDDMGVAKKDVAEGNPFDRVVGIMQNVENPTNQAEAHNKGMITWNVDTLVVTSNVEMLGVQDYVTNPIAVMRRFHIYLEVLPANYDHYASSGFDYQHLDPAYFETGMKWVFHKVEPKINPTQPLVNQAPAMMKVHECNRRSDALRFIYFCMKAHRQLELQKKERSKEATCFACFKKPCDCGRHAYVSSDVAELAIALSEEAMSKKPLAPVPPRLPIERELKDFISPLSDSLDTLVGENLDLEPFEEKKEEDNGNDLPIAPVLPDDEKKEVDYTTSSMYVPCTGYLRSAYLTYKHALYLGVYFIGLVMYYAYTHGIFFDSFLRMKTLMWEFWFHVRLYVVPLLPVSIAIMWHSLYLWIKDVLHAAERFRIDFFTHYLTISHFIANIAYFINTCMVWYYRCNIRYFKWRWKDKLSSHRSLLLALATFLSVGFLTYKMMNRGYRASVGEHRDLKAPTGTSMHGVKRTHKRLVRLILGRHVNYGYFYDSNWILTVCHMFRNASPSDCVIVQDREGVEIARVPMKNVVQHPENDNAFIQIGNTASRFDSLFHSSNFKRVAPMCDDGEFLVYDPEVAWPEQRASAYFRAKFLRVDRQVTYGFSSFSRIKPPELYVFESVNRKVARGDCGLIVVDRTGANVGMIVASTDENDTFLCVPFPACSLMPVMDNPVIVPKIAGTFTDKVEFVATTMPFGGAAKIGTVHGYQVPTAKTSVKESAFGKLPLVICGEELKTHMYGPPPLHRQDGKSVRTKVYDTFHRNLEILARVPARVCPELVGRSSDCFYSRLRDCITEEDRAFIHPETYENAMLGLHRGEKVLGLRPAKMDTSIGYPFEGKASKYMRVIDGKFEMDEELAAYVAQFEGELLAGRTPFTLSRAHPKDEVVKTTKDKNRLFNITCKGTFMVFKKYFWWVGYLAYKYPIGFEAAYGINPYSPEWNELQEYLESEGFDNHMAADFSDWDLRIPGELVSAAFRILVRIAMDLGHDFPGEEFFLAVEKLLTQPAVLFGTTIWLLRQGVLTGHPLTYLLNCFINSLRERICFYSLFPDKRFSDHVKAIYGGDDAHTTTNLPEYNQLSTLEIMLEMGLRPTDSNKQLVTTPFMPLSEVTFLKRDRAGRLAKDSIHKMLSWTTSTKQLHAEGALVSALFELHMYGKEEFDAFIASLYASADKILEIDPANGIDIRSLLKAHEKFLDFESETYRFTSTLSERKMECRFNQRFLEFIQDA